MTPAMARADTRLVMWVIPVVYVFFVGAEFLAMTNLALDLTTRGFTALQVGIVASAMWMGICAASLVSHRMVTWLGYARTFVVFTAAAMLAIASMAWHATYPLWLLGAATLGISGGFVWVAGESWLTEAAPSERRGFFVGLFETSVGIGMVTGPALLPVAHALALHPAHLATAMMGVALLGSLPLLRQVAPAMHNAVESGEASRPWRAVAVPLAAMAVVSGLLEAGISAMLPPISMRLGFDVSSAAWLGAVIGAGSALVQAPAGLVADRFGMRRTTLIAWALVMATTTLLVVMANEPARVLWLVGFVLAGVGGSVYTLVVIELGHRLRGSDLIRAMSLLVTAYTAGTAVGPATGGWAFDNFGLRGLAVGLLAAGIVGAWLAERATRSPTPAQDRLTVV